MWCKNCNLETNEAVCPVCGLETSEDLPVEIYWCNDCRIPVIHVSTAADKGICPVCHGKTRYLTADLRPVFPEERLLIALLLDKDPDALMQKSVWATGSRYYIDGKSLSISTKTFETADIDKINDLLEKSADAIDYTFFDENIHRFVLANQHIHDAMDILESVRKSSGMIGIISHVQLLESCIPTHLEVIKTSAGSIIATV